MMSSGSSPTTNVYPITLVYSHSFAQHSSTPLKRPDRTQLKPSWNPVGTQLEPRWQPVTRSGSQVDASGHLASLWAEHRVDVEPTSMASTNRANRSSFHQCNSTVLARTKKKPESQRTVSAAKLGAGRTRPGASTGRWRRVRRPRPGTGGVGGRPASWTGGRPTGRSASRTTGPTGRPRPTRLRNSNPTAADRRRP